MKTPVQCQTETRFVALMSQLFQMDEAQALDFGIYRVIRRHNRDIRAYLGEVVTAPDGQQTLHGGKLAQILNEAFKPGDDEAQAADKFRLQDLQQQLGLKPGMTQAQRDAQLAQAEGIPASQALAADYRSRSAAQTGQQSVQADRSEVLNRLYQFFARHYQDGDFIVERRYGKGGARWVKSTGDDTEFHWATEDMYYIKSGDIFTDFDLRLSGGQALRFSVEPISLQATRAALKPNDKAHYELASATKAVDGVTTVQLGYHKGAQTEAQKDQIIAAACQAAQVSATQANTELRRWLAAFMARNQSDFFIHKRLQEALSDDLDIYIKTELLDTDQLLAGTADQPSDLPQRTLQVARIVRQVGRQLIAFLATLEDFQKTLWKKKKLVFETRYVITLDRLERYCPHWLAAHIAAIVTAQRSEWQALGLGDFATTGDCIRHTPGDLASPATASYLPLPVDTGRFDADFKWSMLEAVTLATPLDEALDGVAIQSDNWQALNTLQAKYRQRIQALYADPPYNTDAGPISYKNGYRKSSWATFIQNRLGIVRDYLVNDGVACITIDDFQKTELLEIISKEFGSDNILGIVIIKNSPSGRPSVKGFRVSHEYAIFAGTTINSDIGLLERSQAQSAHFSNSDEDGLFAWDNFRKRGGATTHRTARPKQFYPIYVADKKIRIPKIEWQKEIKEWKVLDAPTDKEIVLLPVNDDGTERVWSWGHLTAIENMKNLEVRRTTEGVVSIFRKVRPQNDGSLPSTIWVKPEYSAVEYGSVLLKNMFNKREFSFPKSVHAVADCLSVSGVHENAFVLDIFAGSGTTPHAVLNLNQDDEGSRKFLIFESNDYINTFTIPRIIKAETSTNWRNGNAEIVDGPGLFMRIQTLEQYDDTLQNLAMDTAAGDSGELLADVPALALSYKLDSFSHKLYMGLEHFLSPFGYQLQRAAGGAAAQAAEVDLVESVPYLLGLDITRLYREPLGVVLLGRNRRAEPVAVFFRDCAAAHSAKWVQDKLLQHPANRVYTNNAAALSFAGCDRLEALEAVFALQFKRT